MNEERIAILTEHGANWDEAMDRMAGNGDFYIHLVGMYASNDHMQLLEEALRNNDVDAAFAHAHSLKGVSGNLSFTDFFDASVSVTEALRERDIKKAKKLFPRLEDIEKKARIAAEMAKSWDQA